MHLHEKDILPRSDEDGHQQVKRTGGICGAIRRNGVIILGLDEAYDICKMLPHLGCFALKSTTVRKWIPKDRKRERNSGH